MVTKERWGKRSIKIEKYLLRKARKIRNKRTGEVFLAIPTFSEVAERYGVTREHVRQIADDVGVRSMYRMKGRGRSIR